MTATRVRLLVYGWLEGLVRADLVYATGHADPLPPIPLMVALVESGGRRILFDAGAAPEWAERKGVTGYVPTPELLPRLGVAVDEIDDLVISHLHWDHASQAPAFQHARTWVQASELAGWRSALEAGPDLRWVHGGRVEARLLDALEASADLVTPEGDADIVPGVTCRLAAGHTFGTQFLEVAAGDGPVVLASDVVFTRENVARMIPLGNGLDQVAMLRSIARARDAAVGGLLIPGHDPAALADLQALDERAFEVR